MSVAERLEVGTWSAGSQIAGEAVSYMKCDMARDNYSSL